jgi:hypothetical protein
MLMEGNMAMHCRQLHIQGHEKVVQMLLEGYEKVSLL